MYALTLSRSELASLRESQESLLDVLNVPDVLAWQHQVNRSVQRLIAADRSVFSLPGQSPASLLATNDTPPEFRDAFLEFVHPSGSGGMEIGDPAVRDAQATRLRGGSGVYHLEDLTPASIRRESPMYNEVFNPYGFPHMTGLSTPIMGTEATQFFGFDRSDAPGYGERGKRLLELLVPAFESAVRIHHRMRTARGRLGALFDQLGQPMAVYSAAGEPIYRSRRLRELLAAEPESERVTAAADALARRMATGSAGSPVDPAGRQVTTPAGPWRLCAAAAPTTLHGAAILVVAEPASPRFPTAPALQARFDLTPRQASVARLMGYGLGDHDIAERLSISWHTARRHARAVLKKLELSSRAAVAMTLLGHTAPAPPRPDGA